MTWALSFCHTQDPRDDEGRQLLVQFFLVGKNCKLEKLEQVNIQNQL